MTGFEPKQRNIVNRWQRLALALMCSAALFGASCSESKRYKPSYPGAVVQINGVEWRVQCAMTRLQREAGLGGRRKLAEGTGMLFIYPTPRKVAFCMRGCEIPLDIAFIDADMKVVATYTMAVEPDRVGRKEYPSGAPAQYALEVSAGALAKAGVQLGQVATFKGNMPPAVKADP